MLFSTQRLVKMHSVQCIIFMACVVFQSVQTTTYNQRFLSRHKKYPFTEQLVFYPWDEPFYQSPYPPNVRDLHGGPFEDRTRHFWANLLNNFRNGWTSNVNSADNNGIRLANNLVAALGEEGMKQLAYYVGVTISPGPPGPPGLKGTKGDKGDKGELSSVIFPEFIQNQQGIIKGEKGEKGSCGCNEESTTTTESYTTITEESTTTFEPITTESTTKWPTTTQVLTTKDGTLTTDGLLTTDIFTTTESITTTQTTSSETTTTPGEFETTENTAPTVPTEGPTSGSTTITDESNITTDGLPTTIASTTSEKPGSTTEELSTITEESSTTVVSTEESSPTTDGPNTTTEEISPTVSSTTPENPSTTVDSTTSETPDTTTVNPTIPEEHGSTTAFTTSDPGTTTQSNTPEGSTFPEEIGSTTVESTTSKEPGSSEGSSTTHIPTTEGSITTADSTTNHQTPDTTTKGPHTTTEETTSEGSNTATTTEEPLTTPTSFTITEESSTPIGSTTPNEPGTTTIDSITTPDTTTKGTTTEGSISSTTITEGPSTTLSSTTSVQPDTTTIGITTTSNPDSLILGCDQTAKYKNATWNSPLSGSNFTSNLCELTLELEDKNSMRKNHEPICQIRLDFHEFSITQPNRQSRCATDQFRVMNVENKVPVICGDNPRQHMYLTPLSSENEVKLIFTFGRLESSPRLWEIKITLIPCCANHLIAPNDCLQYFNDLGGIIKSFNWIEGTPGRPRQLANQEYNICFKSDSLVSSICYKPCPVRTGLAFSVSQNSRQRPYRAGAGVEDCRDDFILIANGYNRFDPSMINDRFCGNIFNSNGNVTANQPAMTAVASTTICSKVKPFQLYYTTNGEELVDISNNGFCLEYQLEYNRKN